MIFKWNFVEFIHLKQFNLFFKFVHIILPLFLLMFEYAKFITKTYGPIKLFLR